MPDPLDGVRVIEGDLDAKGARFAILVSRFNSFITDRLLGGAVDTLRRLGAEAEDITVIKVPGAWELPQTAARVLETESYDAVIALGCLMKGDTIHFDLIASEAAKGLSALGQQSKIPVLFGVLTTNDLEQAVHRAGAKYGNKGAEVAQAAVEQVRVYAALGRKGTRRRKK
ncbi:MAG: 6,7-dimethyl-8-ribityllumazine synthase [Nannocystaceae bacterium]|nr:6,7-dimethyl-8-ribityllumazine synthase [bacterium]